MKIAIPVKDESLTFFSNAGHTPKFAIYTQTGSGMFRSFKLDSIINNPRTDLDHDHAEEDHACDHAHDDEEHIAQHNKMGTALKGCNYVVVKKACKNTANSFTSQGIKLVKYNGESVLVDAILKETSAAFV
ncbi:MAG: NifB/NifX family molybdenum-iron cluster-binding protein [Candidatus Marinarcus sp.]|uniref:NifB/NifX family molybdenum-iron cluster-binding protein n=1 Tax=Candidatus Marinarcus sp. TaxID=3100987 RepID=UPI003B000B99